MSTLLKNTTTSWKTSVFGLTQWLATMSVQIGYIFDEAALGTEPDWNLVVVSTMAFLGLLTARDGDRSSEDVGAK